MTEFDLDPRSRSILRSWARMIPNFYSVEDDGKVAKHSLAQMLVEKKDPQLYVGLWNSIDLDPMENLVKAGIVVLKECNDYPVPKTRVYVTRKGIEILVTFRSFNDL